MSDKFQSALERYLKRKKEAESLPRHHRNLNLVPSLAARESEVQYAWEAHCLHRVAPLGD